MVILLIYEWTYWEFLYLADAVTTRGGTIEDGSYSWNTFDSLTSTNPHQFVIQYDKKYYLTNNKPTIESTTHEIFAVGQ